MKRRNSSINIFILLSIIVVLSVVAVLSVRADTGIQFIDVTQEAGIHWKHTDGRSGQKYFMETLGSGAAFFDYDADGDPIYTSLTAHRSPVTLHKRPQPIVSTAITVMALSRMSQKKPALEIQATDTDALWGITITTVN